MLHNILLLLYVLKENTKIHHCLTLKTIFAYED